MNIKAGDKVRCIDAGVTRGTGEPTHLTLGKVYTAIQASPELYVLIFLDDRGVATSLATDRFVLVNKIERHLPSWF